MTRPGAAVLPVAAALLLASPPARAGAQEIELSGAEAGVLREVASLEARGLQDRAEERVRELLARDPGSAAGVYALERVLRGRERLADVLPAVDAYLSREPRGRAVRMLQLRVLAELDSLDALERAGRAWIAADSASLDTYREVIGVFDTALGPGPALALVQEARAETGSPAALALEAGDLEARAGDPEGAVEEWARAVGKDGTSLAGVLRRLEDLPGERTALVGSLVDALSADPTTADRLRAAAHVALDAGLDARAVEAAERALPRLDHRTRKGFLLELVRRAERTGSDRTALWAYESLREAAESPGEARALDRRIVEMALATGDTARAVAAQEGLVAGIEGASGEQRQARATLVRLEAEAGRVDAAREGLEAFRRSFPDAPETDVLAASVSRALLRADRIDDAQAALDGVSGPESGVQRAYLSLAWEDVEGASEELSRALDGLPPERATGVIELVTLLKETSPEGALLAGRTAGLAHRGEAGAALRALDGELPDVPVDDRPGILALGARIAEEAGRPGEAARLRSRLVRDHPDSPEAAEATVRLARWMGRDEEGAEEAARMLEELILSRPESAVIPEARRELQRVRGRIPGGTR